MMHRSSVDKDLAQRLLERLGPRGVLLDAADVALFEISARHGGGKACAVVRPADGDELAWAMHELIGSGAHLVTQGAATGLVSAGTPSEDGTQWVLSTQRLRDVLEIDAKNRSATISAGFRLSDLNREAAAHGLAFPIDLGADPTIGGMVATNTGGARLIRYGGVRENLLAVEAVLAAPAGLRVGGRRRLRKNNTGLDWPQLLCGSFGAFGVITSATVKLHPLQRQSATALAAVASAEAAVELACSLELEMGEFVSAFEGLSRGALEAVALHQGSNIFPSTPEYAVLLEVSSTVTRGRGLDLEAMLMEWLEARLEEGEVLDAVVDKPEQLWRVRHAVSESVQSLGHLVAFDVAVARSALGAFRRRSQAVIDEVVPEARLCDFGHLGDGGMHLNMVVPAATTPECVAILRSRIYELVVEEFAGSFSAEHGVGPYNQAFYDRYTEGSLQQLCGALQHALDPGRQLGNVRLGTAD